MKRQKVQEVTRESKLVRQNARAIDTTQGNQENRQDRSTPKGNQKSSHDDGNRKEFKLEVNPVTLTRLVSNNKYEESDIAKVSEYLMRVHEFDFESQFEIADTVEKFKTFLNKSKSIVARGLPIFVLYDTGRNHWVVICVVKSQDYIIFLYKDSLGQIADSQLKNAAKESYSDGTVVYKFHFVKEQINDISCGPMSLRNLEIMLTKFTSDANEFIKNFEKIEFCTENEVQSTKTRYQKDLQKYIAREMTDDIRSLAADEEFKKAISEFIDTCLKYSELSVLSKEYNRLIEDAITNREKDPNYRMNVDLIEEAKKKLFTHDDIKSLKEQINIELNKSSSNKKTEKTTANVTYQLEIQKKFPEQMKKFTDIFTLLTKSTEDDNREETLKQISKELSIDYNKIKAFYEMKETKAKGKIEEKITPTCKDINEIKKHAPSLKENEMQSTKDIKTLEQLLAEIILIPNTNDSSNNKMQNFPVGKSPEYYKNIYKDNTEILELEKACRKVQHLYSKWQAKSMQDIYNWSKTMKGNLRSRDTYEALAIMDRANELVTGGHRLRDSQILSVLVFLRSGNDQGRLSQILTGEGKTVIVSLLAALKVLRGEKVDIITSNQVLAECAVKDRENFYGLFNITVSNNNMDESYVRGPKMCYKADIVYGSIGNFQFDYLRDTFEGLETRAKRSFDNVILDEVDSMLIDNGGYIAKLAGPFPGIDFLKYVYIKIWQELHKAEQKLHVDLANKLEDKKSELSKRAKSENVSEEELQREYKNYLSEQLFDQINVLKAKIKESEPTNIDFLPTHLKGYAARMLDKWIDNAIYAKYECRENEQYVIKSKIGKGDVIVPVDYENTGVTLRNTIWSNGLHQFVQLKHNLCLTSESLTSSFISNIGYIKLYDNKLYGLTGTLGSLAEQRLLSKAYNIDYAKIPTYKKKKFQELKGVVVKEQQWKNYIAITSVKKSLEKRSVLIICKTINDLQLIEKTIEAVKKLEGCKTLKVRTYPDEDSSKIVDTEIGPGEIIVATNIAGRGTDLKTSMELEKNGGLHVCVCFLPVNQRVEDQAFGRTSRQGNSGSAQLVLKGSDVTELGIRITPNLKFITIKKRRDILEKLRLQNIVDKELMEIDFQDNLFRRFSNLYSEFRGDTIENANNHFLTKDLKEHWAFWLIEKDYQNKDLSKANVNEEFMNFMNDSKTIQILGKKVNDKYVGGEISHNPYYCITQAENFLNRNKIDQAEIAIKRAIKLSDKNELLYSAYMKLFEIEIEKGCQLRERFAKAVKEVLLINVFVNVKKTEKYKIYAKDALKKAASALDTEISYIRRNFFGDNVNRSVEDTDDTKNESNTPTNQDFINILISGDNLLIKDIRARYVALDTFKQHAQSLLNQINENPDKGIAMNARIPDYLKDLDSKKSGEKELKDSLTESTLTELKYVGLETVYSLKEIHDVPSEIIHRAQGQIAAGIAAIGIGIAFPPSAFVMGRLASTLITEGICDIIIELISRGDTEFDETVYVKGKCISYGISFLTMGLDALLTCTDLLNRAINACKTLSSKLKNCRYFASLCKRLANCLDRLAVYLTRLKYVAKVQQFNKVKEFSKAQYFCTTLKSAGKEALKSVVGSVVMEKIVTKGLDVMLTKMKPRIEEYVEKTVREELKEDHLRMIKTEEMYELIKRILIGTYGEIATDVLKEIALGMLRHSNNFKAKVTSLAIDTGMLLHNIGYYTRDFCMKFKVQLNKTKEEKSYDKKFDNDTEEMMKVIIGQVTEKIYSMIIQLLGKYTNTFVVTPIMHKVWNFLEGTKVSSENSLPETIEEMEDFCNIVDAYEELNLDPNATMDDIERAYREAVKKHQSNASSSNENDSNAKKKIEKLTEAYQILLKLQVKTNYTSLASTLKDNKSSKDNDKEAHTANIETLCEENELYIIVNKKKPNGEVETIEFGKEYQKDGEEPIMLDYFPPNDEHNGHYTLPKEMKHIKVTSTGTKNCLYDNVAAQLQARGCEITSQELRDTATRTNPNNVYHDMLQDASKVLKNKITVELYLKIQAELLVGGDVRYYPEDADSSEAEKIFKRSQGKPSEALLEKSRITGKPPANAHPLEHTICSNHTETPEHSNVTCAQNITKTYGTKNTSLPEDHMYSTANEVMHMDCYKDAVDRLNNDALEVELKVPANKLQKNANRNLTHVKKGNLKQTEPAKSFTFIIGHQAGTLNDKDADPNIKTAYPTNKEINDIELKNTWPRTKPDQSK